VAHAILVAAVIVVATGCGSSGSTGSPGTSATTKPAATTAVAGRTAVEDPLAGLTALQIARRALTATKEARSVRVTGTAAHSGQLLTFDLTLEHGKGCVGSISETNRGSFRLVYNGTAVWIMPGKSFFQSQHATAAVLDALSGKYVEVKSASDSLGGLARMCTLSRLLAFNFAPGLTRHEITLIRAQRALTITDVGVTGYLYVSDTASPKVLRVEAPGADGGSIDFSYPAAMPITAPPANQVVLGSKYGF
jgi:hypothetical protein